MSRRWKKRLGKTFFREQELTIIGCICATEKLRYNLNATVAVYVPFGKPSDKDVFSGAAFGICEAVDGTLPRKSIK